MQKINSNDKIQLIYIAGYGHSGSTILEILLSCGDGIIGLGELVGIPRELNASFTKEFLGKNEFCRNLFSRVETKLEEEGESLKSILELNQFERMINRDKKKLSSRYHKFWNTFLIAAKEDPHQKIIGFVDSSKTSFAHALRPYLLQKNKNIEVTVIHVIRHPQQILWRHKVKAVVLSNKAEPEWLSQLKQIFKTTLNWAFSNIIPAILHNKTYKYVRISFEELCEFPVKTLEKIQRDTHLNLENSIDRVRNRKPLPSTCGIAGNIPVKKQEEELRFEPSKKSIKEVGPFLKVLSTLLLPIYGILTK